MGWDGVLWCLHLLMLSDIMCVTGERLDRLVGSWLLADVMPICLIVSCGVSACRCSSLDQSSDRFHPSSFCGSCWRRWWLGFYLVPSSPRSSFWTIIFEVGAHPPCSTENHCPLLKVIDYYLVAGIHVEVFCLFSSYFSLLPKVDDKLWSSILYWCGSHHIGCHTITRLLDCHSRTCQLMHVYCRFSF